VRRRGVPQGQGLGRVLLSLERTAASFSVHEGTSRTLKDHDLCLVRNAIWEKTGF
ncbi:Os12g0503550, partial [Oryza sativa Japonica Group]